MKTYDIYKHPTRGIEIVKIGFSWPAFFFGFFCNADDPKDRLPQTEVPKAQLIARGIQSVYNARTMPIYQVTALAENKDVVRQSIAAEIDQKDRHAITNEAGWFVRYPGTTIELSHKLKITGQPPGENSPIGPALITLISSYYGRGPTDMWEWLKTRFESES